MRIPARTLAHVLLALAAGACTDPTGAGTARPGATRPSADLAEGALSAFVVTSTVDAVDALPGDGVCATALQADGAAPCTLRAAVQEANALPGAQTVTLPAGTYPLTILSATQGSGAESGGLDVVDALTVEGAGAASTAIDCAGPGDPAAPWQAPCGIYGGPMFAIHAAPVVITGVTLTRTNPTLGSIVSAALVDIDAGASLTLRDAAVRQHRYIAIWNRGTLALQRVTVADNASGSTGAGLNNRGTATITASTFSGNSANYGGAAIANFGTLTLTNSTLSDNANVGDVLEGGGALSNWGTATLNGVTIAGNTLAVGLASWGFAAGVTSYPAGVLRMGNTILAGNTVSFISLETMSRVTVAGDCMGPITSLGYNLIGSLNGCTALGKTTGDLAGVDPLLGPLADNGGPTLTRALLPGSPAIDAGHPARSARAPHACPSTDQRGFPRVDRCDIGAYEAQQ